MIVNTANQHFSGLINFSETCGVIHTEHWQGLHVAICRLIQVSRQHPKARLRHAFQDYYAIEWMLDGSWIPW